MLLPLIQGTESVNHEFLCWLTSITSVPAAFAAAAVYLRILVGECPLGRGVAHATSTPAVDLIMLLCAASRGALWPGQIVVVDIAVVSFLSCHALKP